MIKRGEDIACNEWFVESKGGVVYLDTYEEYGSATHAYTPDQARDLIEALHNAILTVTDAPRPTTTGLPNWAVDTPMSGYYVTWYASGVAYVEAQSTADALELLERSPELFIDMNDHKIDVTGEYVTSAD